MADLITDMRLMPLAYRCAIEWVGTSPDRCQATLDAGIDHFERVYGLTGSEDAPRWRESARVICERRYWNWQA